MRIEKISETQVKFILTNDDFAERNIKPTELAYGSDKAQQLFQEMMQQAMAECAFESANAPLMVEAMPVDSGNVVVVVTKITDASGIERKLNFLPLARAAARFKKMDLIEPPPENENEDSVSIFSFDSIDTIADLSLRLHKQFSGVSRVYKYNGRYYLLLQNETEDGRSTAELEMVLHEYGKKHISSGISKHYLSERAEVIIREDAIHKLSIMAAQH